MELVNDIYRLKEVVENNELSLIYIKALDCGLCSIMFDKIDALCRRFDRLATACVELHVVPHVAGEFLVATAPTVLLFANGKEVHRQGTFINMQELEHVLTRWYENITLSPLYC